MQSALAFRCRAGWADNREVQRTGVVERYLTLSRNFKSKERRLPGIGRWARRASGLAQPCDRGKHTMKNLRRWNAT
jgi:hypothetical protein